MEKDAKAEKLQQYISDKHKKHLRYLNFLFINYYTIISTHISVQLYTHLDFWYVPFMYLT